MAFRRMQRPLRRKQSGVRKLHIASIEARYFCVLVYRRPRWGTHRMTRAREEVSGRLLSRQAIRIRRIPKPEVSRASSFLPIAGADQATQSRQTQGRPHRTTARRPARCHPALPWLTLKSRDARAIKYSLLPCKPTSGHACFHGRQRLMLLLG